MMTGLEICALIMTTIRDGTTSNWFTETFRVGKAFSRTRKLSMPLVMLFLMFKTKASMPNEIDSFLHRFRVSISEILGKQAQTFTKQALSKARKGIDIKAFEWLVTSSVNTFFAYSDAIRTWCNLLVFAVDGTDVQLPQRAPPRETFSPIQLWSLCGRKTQPDFHKCKSPCVASAKRHHTRSCVFGHMAGTANDVVYDGAYPAAFYPAFLVGLVPKRLLPNHAKQIVGNESKF